MSKDKTAEPIAADFTEEVGPAGGRDLATRDQQGGAMATTGEQSAWNPMAMMSMVRELALDERIDGTKLETIMRVANEQQDRAREIEFYQAKNRAVRQMPMIRKDGRIVIADKAAPNDRSKDRTQGHFEKWSDVQAAVTPVLDANNLTLTHKVDHSDGQTIVIAVLTHDNGFREESGPMRLPLDTSGGKNNVQGAGSSQTYGMRYTTRAICGLKLIGGQGDDDGNLIPLPDEPLNDQQMKRVREGEAAIAAGPEVYEEWFHKLDPRDRVWLIQTGRHSAWTGGTGGLLADQRTATDQTPPADDAPKSGDQGGGNGGKRKGPTMTPEQWTAQYEADCAAVGDLDALAELQDRQRKALTSLKDRDATLHARCVRAGSEAYARLSSPADDAASGDDLFHGGK
jgi:hypothetical protein